MKILIAPNAFKNSISARQAALAMQQGLAESMLKPDCLLQPIADGGDGMLEVLISQTGGKQLFAEVADPLGRPVKAAYGLIHEGKTAVIEMAEASGLRLLSREELNPMHTSTYGTGQLIREALAQGVERIIIGVGGSATVDGGLGMAMALGATLTDSTGNMIPKGAQGLEKLHHIDLSTVDKRLQHTQLIIACDVTTPLLEAARVYGPQKGATPAMVATISLGLQQYAHLVQSQLNMDIASLTSGGAAGGIAATLCALFNASLVNGTDFLLAQTGFREHLQQADMVITAEGALDVQTQAGKGPFYVARQARQLHKPVVMLAGSLPQPFKASDYAIYDAVFAIGSRPESLEEAILHTEQNLRRMAQQIGNLLALKI